MTRKEEIITAAVERADRHEIAERELNNYNNKFYFYERIYDSEIASFAVGAEWADEHPKCPWISVKDDLPRNHKELISSEDKRNTLYVITLVHSFVVLSRMEKFEGEWHWTTDEPAYWMPIPELPK